MTLLHEKAVSTAASRQSLRFTYLRSCLKFCRQPGCHNAHTPSCVSPLEPSYLHSQGRGPKSPGRGGTAAHKQIYVDGGAWSKERHTVCRLRGRAGKRKKKRKELPSRHMSKPITAEHRLLFPHPKSPPPPLFILWR